MWDFQLSAIYCIIKNTPVWITWVMWCNWNEALSVWNRVRVAIIIWKKSKMFPVTSQCTNSGQNILGTCVTIHYFGGGEPKIIFCVLNHFLRIPSFSHVCCGSQRRCTSYICPNAIYLPPMSRALQSTQEFYFSFVLHFHISTAKIW